jgi:hypothetical protein
VAASHRETGEPGEYTLRPVVNDGQSLHSRTAAVTIAR